MDEAAPVRLAQRGGDADSEPQEPSRFHRRADESRKRLAARILEQQRRSTALAGECQRTCRPSGIELVPQFIFVGKAIEDRRRRVILGWQRNQHGAAAAVDADAQCPAEDTFAILPRDLEISNSISAEPKGWVHSPNSAAPPRSRFACFPPQLCR